MAGTIVADDIQHSTAGSVGTEYVVQGSAKAWVNLTGTGTISINDSFNVSSISDQATGKYRITQSNAMSSASYSYGAGHVKSGDNSPHAGYNGSLTTTQWQLESTNFGSYIDADRATGQSFGDLA